MKSNAHRKGLIFASIHTVLFFVMVISINSSSDGQAPMAWGFFVFIDMPISLLYFIPDEIYTIISSSFGDSSIVNQIFYAPHIIHGLFGGIWYYFLPRLFMPRRFGGIWGRKQNETKA